MDNNEIRKMTVELEMKTDKFDRQIKEIQEKLKGLKVLDIISETNTPESIKVSLNYHANTKALDEAKEKLDAAQKSAAGFRAQLAELSSKKFGAVDSSAISRNKKEINDVLGLLKKIKDARDASRGTINDISEFSESNKGLPASKRKKMIAEMIADEKFGVDELAKLNKEYSELLKRIGVEIPSEAPKTLADLKAYVNGLDGIVKKVSSYNNTLVAAGELLKSPAEAKKANDEQVAALKDNLGKAEKAITEAEASVKALTAKKEAMDKQIAELSRPSSDGGASPSSAIEGNTKVLNDNAKAKEIENQTKAINDNTNAKRENAKLTQEITSQPQKVQIVGAESLDAILKKAESILRALVKIYKRLGALAKENATKENDEQKKTVSELQEKVAALEAEAKKVVEVANSFVAAEKQKQEALDATIAKIKEAANLQAEQKQKQKADADEAKRQAKEKAEADKQAAKDQTKADRQRQKEQAETDRAWDRYEKEQENKKEEERQAYAQYRRWRKDPYSDLEPDEKAEQKAAERAGAKDVERKNINISGDEILAKDALEAERRERQIIAEKKKQDAQKEKAEEKRVAKEAREKEKAEERTRREQEKQRQREEAKAKREAQAIDRQREREVEKLERKNAGLYTKIEEPKHAKDYMKGVQKDRQNGVSLEERKANAEKFNEVLVRRLELYRSTEKILKQIAALEEKARTAIDTGTAVGKSWEANKSKLSALRDELTKREENWVNQRSGYDELSQAQANRVREALSRENPYDISAQVRQEQQSRLQSNRIGRDSLFSEYQSAGAFGSGQGFSEQINALRKTQESAWLDYKKAREIGDTASAGKFLQQLGQAKSYEQQLIKYLKEYNSVLGTTETMWGKFTRKLYSHLNWIVAGATLDAIFTIPSETLNRLIETDEALHNLGTVMRSLEETKIVDGKEVHTGRQDMDAVYEEYKKLTAAAAEYGATTDDIFESARLWGRMYKDVNTVNTLTAQSAKLAVADNFSVEESTRAVEAAMFQFGLQARTSAESLAFSNQIIDVYTALSHQAGVSAQDLARGVERTGAVAHQAGMDFEFLNALIAQGTRSTALSGQEIGNMLKTLIGSFRDTKAIAALGNLGISVTETKDGVEQYRSVQDVLLDVAIAAQTTDNDLQKLFKGISGGKFQWSKAAAMFSDYGEIIKNWGLAVRSMNFTDTQVQTQMDSLSRRIQQLKTDMESLLIGGAMNENGLSDKIKGIVSALDGLVRWLNSIPTSTYDSVLYIGKLIATILALKVAVGAITSTWNALKVSVAQYVMTTNGATIVTAKQTAALDAEALAAKRDAAEQAKLANAKAAQQLANGNSMGALVTKVGGASGAIGMLIKGVGRLIPYVSVAVGVVELASYAFDSMKSSSEEAAKAQNKLADSFAQHEQLTHRYEEESKFVSALCDGYVKYKEAIDSGSLSTEKRAVAEKQLGIIESELATMVSQAAVDEIKSSDNVAEAAKALKTTFVNSREDMATSENKKMSTLFDNAMKELSMTKEKIAAIEAERDAFVQGNDDKVKSLGFLQKMELKYYRWRTGNANSSANDAKARWDKARENYGAAVDRNESDEKLSLLAKEVGDAKSDYDYWVKNAEDMAEREKKGREDIFNEEHPELHNLKEQESKLEEVTGNTMKLWTAFSPNNPGGTTVGEGDMGGGNSFGGSDKLPMISQPNINLIPKEFSAGLTAIKNSVDEVDKTLQAKLEIIKGTIEDYGATPQSTEAIMQIYDKRIEAQREGGKKVNKLLAKLMAEHGEELAGTAVIKGVGTASTNGFKSTGNADYDAWIAQYAQENGVSPSLLYAVLNQESGFNPNAVSSAGAIGIAQFTPDTAKDFGIDPYDAQQSIEAAAKYLKQNYDRFGSWELSLAAYNAGPGAVEDFENTIPPYAETQNYVSSVMAAAEEAAVEAIDVSEQLAESSQTLAQAYAAEAKETNKAWGDMSKQERLAWADAHKDSIAQANMFIQLQQQVDAMAKQAAAYNLQAEKLEREQAKQVTSLFDEEVKTATRNVTRESKRKALAAGPNATPDDQMKGEIEALDKEIELRHEQLNRKRQDSDEYYIKRGTIAYEDYCDKIMQLEQDRDKKVVELADKRYSNEKETYERHAKKRDLLIGDTKEGNVWWNSYGERQQNAILDAEAEVERLHKKLDTLRNDTKKKDIKAIEETENALLEAEKNARDAREAGHKVIRDSWYQLADDILMQGQSIEDVFANLWKQLGQDALKILFKQDVGEGSPLLKLLALFKGGQASTVPEIHEDRDRLKDFQLANYDWLKKSSPYKSESVADRFSNLNDWHDLSGLLNTQWDWQKGLHVEVEKDATAQEQTQATINTLETGTEKIVTSVNAVRDAVVQAGGGTGNTGSDIIGVAEDTASAPVTVATPTVSTGTSTVSTDYSFDQYNSLLTGNTTGLQSVATGLNLLHTDMQQQYAFDSKQYSIQDNLAGEMSKNSNKIDLNTKQSIVDTQTTDENSSWLQQNAGTLAGVVGLLGGLFGNSKGGKIFSAVASFGLALLSTGGSLSNIRGYATGGAPAGKITGAGTGRSDSILGYLANKDKFVMLSNGEYVINEKSAKALGYDTLDALNKYADGGVITPEAYVPSLNPTTVSKTMTYTSNGTGKWDATNAALMEKQNQMMAEQNGMLKNANTQQQGGGQVVVLNTHASSDDVMRAIQENPRALQALLGRQNRMGFR